MVGLLALPVAVNFDVGVEVPIPILLLLSIIIELPTVLAPVNFTIFPAVPEPVTAV